MAVGDILRVVTEVAGPDTERLVNVWHYLQLTGAASPVPSDMNTIADVFDNQLGATIISMVSTNCTYGQTVVTILTGASAAFQGMSNLTTGAAGGSAGSVGTIERCLLMRKTTARVGRQFRGRAYIPVPCLETFNSQGTYDAGNPDFGSQTAALPLFTASVTVTQNTVSCLYAPCIFHRSTLTADRVTGHNYSSLVGVQRRRRIGIGD